MVRVRVRIRVRVRKNYKSRKVGNSVSNSSLSYIGSSISCHCFSSVLTVH